MANPVSALWHRFRGTGSASVAVPLFDGPLKPNEILDGAKVFYTGKEIRDCTRDGSGGLLVGSGNEVLRVSADGATTKVADFEGAVNAVAFSPAGVLAVGLEHRVMLQGGRLGAKEITTSGDGPLNSVSALAFDAVGRLLVCEGSEQVSSEDWKLDLMADGKTGRVTAYDPDSCTPHILAQGLRYAFGVCAANGRVLISESWGHRIVEAVDGRVLPVLSDLPGYPARIAAASDGGYWLSLFAKRTQLIEFVLREREYRDAMIASIPSDYWISPRFASGKDALEPLQFGALRTMGILKPWAPSGSHGVVIRLDANLIPQYSMHSRTGGSNHGTVSAVESGGLLYVLSRGSGRILQLAPSIGERIGQE